MALEEKEKQIEELERAVQEMKLKKYSGSSTTAGTDLGNDSCLKHTHSGGSGPGSGMFTSPTNAGHLLNGNDLTDSINIMRNPPSIDVSRDESQ